MYSYKNNKYKYYYKCNYFYFLLNKGLNKLYTMRDIKHTKDNPQGIIVIKVITISILLSLSVQFGVEVLL